MKLDTYEFGKALKTAGFDFYSGVPCSFLKDLINYAINDCHYVMAVNEGDAVAISSGAALSGKKAVVLMQNSGLTNAVSPLTSLNYCFKLPVLGFVSLRGEEGLGDEPQHELMGTITEKMLELMAVKWAYLSPNMTEATAQLAQAEQHIANNETFFFVVKKGTFDKVALLPQEQHFSRNTHFVAKSGADSLPTRTAVLESLNALKTDNTMLLATTGKTGRELYEVEDAKNNLYMVGSMGCISSLGLGAALSAKDKDIIAIDGDGALLMRMGNMATVGFNSPDNLLHLVLDNNTHDSTGGQDTISHNTDFAQIAASCGYKNVVYAHSVEQMTEAVKFWQANKGLTFIVLKTAKGSKKDLGRPKVKPYEVKERLMTFMG